MLDKLTASVWSELDQDCSDGRNDRKPMITSLRRNLQREHAQRLIDLVLREPTDTAAFKPIGTLAKMHLRKLKDRIAASLAKCGGKMDAYSSAHLMEIQERIARVLEANFIAGANPAQQQPQVIILGGETPASE
jgi:hypothetical protein